MSNTINDDMDDERTDELPVLLETVVLDAADPRLPGPPSAPALATNEGLEDTAEHTARYPAFAAAEAAELEDLRSDLEARGARIAALESDIARLTARWADVEAHLSSKDTEIAALKRIVDDVGAAVAEQRAAELRARAELGERAVKLERLEAELEAVRLAAVETAADHGAAAL
jgi:chromosome segregation ATPase